MLNKLLALCLLGTLPAFAQPTPPATDVRPALSVETIMQDPRQWVGTSPSAPFWSEDSRTLYFLWNKDKAPGDSLYKITFPTDRKATPYPNRPAPEKVSLAERRLLPPVGDEPLYNRARTLRLYEKYGDIYLASGPTARQPAPLGAPVRTLTATVERESNPVFSGDERAVIFTRAQNLYRLDLSTGLTEQLTHFDPAAKKPDTKPNEQEAWLKKDQLALFEVLRLRKAKRDETDRTTKAEQPRRPKTIGTEGRTVANAALSPDGRVITYTLLKASTAKTTIVPNYITESGFTEDIPGRTKVGGPLATAELWVYDLRRDTALAVSLANVPDLGKRPVYVSAPVWAEGPAARYAVVSLRAQDNKDRWLMLLDTETPTTLKLLDRQHDDARLARRANHLLPERSRRLFTPLHAQRADSAVGTPNRYPAY
jgi:hypothetical protein